MLSAAAMSAARASRSAPASARPSSAVDGCVPLISASPSFGAERDRLQPGARERLRRLQRTSSDGVARLVAEHRFAFADRAPARGAPAAPDRRSRRPTRATAPPDARRD